MLNRINNLLKQEQETKILEEQIKRQKELEKAERQKATNEILEAAKLLGINLETNNTIIKNEIIINKGKIIELTKEVEVQVTDTEQIEQLERENHVYKGMVAGYEAQLQNKDLAIESLERQIEELKEELFGKELLLNEFRETTDKLIKEKNDLLDKAEGQELEILTLEEQNSFLEGKVMGLQNELKEKPKTVYVEVETEHLEEEQPIEETKVVPQTNKRKIEMDLTIYDLHKTHDGCYRGYTKEYEFVWDTVKNLPAMKLNNGKVWRPMIKEYYQQAQYIKQQILEFKDSVDNKQQDKLETKITKETDEQEIVVNVTNDTHKPGDTWKVSASDIFGSENTDDEDPLGNTDEMEFY